MNKLIKLYKDSLRANWREQHYFNIPELDIYKEIKETDKRFCNCFHYTSMSTFWNILQSDLLYATHVRFSNDTEEYRLGKKIIKSIISSSNEDEQDIYMICFCTKRDLLSQWRDYGRGGVCLGLDLTGEDFFTIQNNELARTELKDNNKYAIPKHGAIDKKEQIYQYAKALKVCYMGKNPNKIKNKYIKIKKMLTSSEIPQDKYLRTMIPYIKHIGFKEENEARLIFQIHEEDSMYLVNYMDKGTIKTPYIKVEFGEIVEKNQEKECVIYADHIGNFDNELNECIKWIETDCNLSIKKKNVNKHSNGQVIIGCTKKQKEVFERIDCLVSEWNYKYPTKKIRIWCRGHIPIREIMVGPSQNKEDIKEAIMHFINNVYWLKYVDVRCTKIPYRDIKN